jgi:hypothetical protein
VNETTAIAVRDAGQPLQFPGECPACGRPGETRVRLTKIFARRTLRGTFWIHHRIDVCACVACADEHQSTIRPDPALAHERTRCPAAQVLPIVVAGAAVVGGGILLASIGVAAASRHSSAIGSATIAALGLGMVGTGIGLMAGGWVARRAVVVPAEWPDAQYAVEVPSVLGARMIIAVPPSPLARAVDFSDNRAGAEELSWRTFSFAREAYAQLFSRLNTGSLYNRRHPIPVSVLANPRALYYVAGAVLAATVAWAMMR